VTTRQYFTLFLTPVKCFFYFFLVSDFLSIVHFFLIARKMLSFIAVALEFLNKYQSQKYLPVDCR